MAVLGSGLRRGLEAACVGGRRAAEEAVRASLVALGVGEDRVPAHLDDAGRGLRVALRAKSRSLGDGPGSLELLVADAAYEQWHRLLFARFLAENSLLMHPDFGAPVSLAECGELALELGEPDGWAVAARFAAEILPGIFRLDDPCVRLPLAAEGRAALEGIVTGLDREVFLADDALGWVYQFWQKERKDAVNASEVKIGGADLGPVTQLFTENYMVRFLLENSLGAWWASRHPESSLISDWEFLRFGEDGKPAAGSFDGWPERVGEVTVMDPCCGSGHFLVEAFSMLWQMRAEEEGLAPVAAQDAVLTDNLFGLELDPRCVQIAMFAVALAAWKAGGGWRVLPVPNIACSGIPVKAPVEEWKALAKGDVALENALVRLHILFRDADTLGSLIDPKRAVEIQDPTGLQSSFDDVAWETVLPALTRALGKENPDPTVAVLGADAQGIVRAADYLSRQYTLVATNVPYLGRKAHSDVLRIYLDRFHFEARADLATAFIERSAALTHDGTHAVVSPDNWCFLVSYREFRISLLTHSRLHVYARLGSGAFSAITGEVVKASLVVISAGATPDSALLIDVADSVGADGKGSDLACSPFRVGLQKELLANPDAVLIVHKLDGGVLLGVRARSIQGLSTGDNPRLAPGFWEVSLGPEWVLAQCSTSVQGLWRGREQVIRWGSTGRYLIDQLGAMRGSDAWGRAGVVVSSSGELRGTLYGGDPFLANCAVLLPGDLTDLLGLWCYVESGEFSKNVRLLDSKLIVTNSTFERVPFDVERWRGVAAERFPDGLPEPWSDDPTQWLFEGDPAVATEPLQVAVGRLVGYRWPEQTEVTPLDDLVDGDGIVCLPSVLGEPAASERVEAVLARAFGEAWSQARLLELLAAAGSKKKSLAEWLRDEFFVQHCKVFKNRPFVWHVWDGRKDGFSALVNYHRLDRETLEKLTYTYLGDWIERQQAGVREGVAGADVRLGAAQALQEKLALILEGEPPFDIFVRWKPLAEQPVGWEPDLDDGVRLNVRPFVTAGVLRSKFNVKWEKDRGKNPDGSERLNDLHFSNADKLQARGRG